MSDEINYKVDLLFKLSKELAKIGVIKVVVEDNIMDNIAHRILKTDCPAFMRPSELSFGCEETGKKFSYAAASD